MSNNNNPTYNRFEQICLHKQMLESSAWNSLSKSEEKVFIYLYSCLQWARIGRPKRWVCANNGQIEVSTIKMRKKLHISKQTCSKAIHQLIKVGFIKLTRVGTNKVCHRYMILHNNCVSQNQQRWRNYPQQDWENECPTRPNSMNGVATRFNSEPRNVD